MNFLIDMNLSPAWVTYLSGEGWGARHWSEIGAPTAPDTDLLRWARENHHILISQDLDFTQLLFQTNDRGPSVILLRLRNEFDEPSRHTVFNAIRLASESLLAGALLVVSSDRARLRKLPLL